MTHEIALVVDPFHRVIFRRADGHHWVIESDIDIKRRHIRLGVQENRATKYFDDGRYPAIAVLDLGLSAEAEAKLMACALELVAAGTRYSLREIIGTAWALRHPAWRPKENLLAREQAFYCSAFVRHVFDQIGIGLALVARRPDLHRAGRQRQRLALAIECVGAVVG